MIALTFAAWVVAVVAVNHLARVQSHEARASDLDRAIDEALELLRA